MNKKRLLFIIALVLIMPAVLFSYESIWGGRLLLNIEAPDIRAATFGITTEDYLLFWYRGSFSDVAKWEAEVGAGFDARFVFGVNDFATKSIGYIGFDYVLYPVINKLNFFGFTDRFTYRVGRQRFRDPAQLIMSDYADGIDFNIYLGSNILAAGVGFTGLVFTDQTYVHMTRTDLAWPKYIATPRLFEYLSWTMPGLGQSITFTALFAAEQELTRTQDLATNTERFNTQYLELVIHGFLGPSILYDLALVGQTGQYGGLNQLSGIGRLGVSWLPKGSRSNLGIDLLASTGDTWERNSYFLADVDPGLTQLNQYLPISTTSTQGFVEEFEIGNLATLAVFFGSKNKRGSFAWELRATTILRTSIGPVSSTLVLEPTSGTGYFLGQEGVLSFLWRPHNDFGAALRLGVLYPGEAIEINQYIAPYFPVLYRLGFDMSFSF